MRYVLLAVALALASATFPSIEADACNASYQYCP